MYWEADERFEERLVKVFGSEPDALETPANDDVVLLIGGKPVWEVIDVAVLETRA